MCSLSTLISLRNLKDKLSNGMTLKVTLSCLDIILSIKNVKSHFQHHLHLQNARKVLGKSKNHYNTALLFAMAWIHDKHFVSIHIQKTEHHVLQIISSSIHTLSLSNPKRSEPFCLFVSFWGGMQATNCTQRTERPTLAALGNTRDNVVEFDIIRIVCLNVGCESV